MILFNVSAYGESRNVEVLHQSECRDYKLEWLGLKPDVEFDPRFGTQNIRITGKDQNHRLLTPKGELFFSDWNYEPCSPNARWLVFLQDRYGPLHCVRYVNLWKYLEGQKPDLSIFGVEGNIGHVHTNIEWVGEQTVQFEVGGAPRIVRRVRLP